MTSEKLGLLVAQGENAKVDFKREWYKKEDIKGELVKDLLALANGDIYTVSETAYLIIGIEDESKSAYTFDTSDIPRSLDKLSQQLLEILNNYAQPEVLSLKIEWVDYEEKEILVLSINPQGKLISLSKDLKLKRTTDKKGTTYYRLGENIRVASADVYESFQRAFSKDESITNNPQKIIHAKTNIEQIDVKDGGIVNIN